jgi:hypothetical protein
MILCISVVQVVVSPFSSIILFTRVPVSLLLISSSLSRLLTSKCTYTHVVLVIFEEVGEFWASLSAILDSPVLCLISNSLVLFWNSKLHSYSLYISICGSGRAFFFLEA